MRKLQLDVKPLREIVLTLKNWLYVLKRLLKLKSIFLEVGLPVDNNFLYHSGCYKVWSIIAKNGKLIYFGPNNCAIQPKRPHHLLYFYLKPF